MFNYLLYQINSELSCAALSTFSASVIRLARYTPVSGKIHTFVCLFVCLFVCCFCFLFFGSSISLTLRKAGSPSTPTWE